MAESTNQNAPHFLEPIALEGEPLEAAFIDPTPFEREIDAVAKFNPVSVLAP